MYGQDLNPESYAICTYVWFVGNRKRAARRAQGQGAAHRRERVLAWIDEEKTRVGYEIPFNRHFYVFKPPRPLYRRLHHADGQLVGEATDGPSRCRSERDVRIVLWP